VVERAGFVCIDASAGGPELRAIVSEERALPAADQRVVGFVRRERLARCCPAFSD
jgi:hypothetical protein